MSRLMGLKIYKIELDKHWQFLKNVLCSVTTNELFVLRSTCFNGIKVVG